MSGAIQKSPGAAVAGQGGPLSVEGFFTEAQEQMILKTFLGGATKEEAVVLLETVRRRRLDPFSRQVYFVKRYDQQKREEVWAIQTSIDGLRSIAERTGKYDGQDEPVYGTDEAGAFCKVKVYRKDWSSGRYAMGVAYFDEFVQRNRQGEVTRFWREKPRLMLAKCAEALAIRKAFPEDAAGIYIEEETGTEEAHPVTPASELPFPSTPPAVEAEKPAAPAPPQPQTPKHVLTLWSRLLLVNGKDATKTQAALARAATELWGETVPPKHLWTEEDCTTLLKISQEPTGG